MARKRHGSEAQTETTPEERAAKERRQENGLAGSWLGPGQGEHKEPAAATSPGTARSPGSPGGGLQRRAPGGAEAWPGLRIQVSLRLSHSLHWPRPSVSPELRRGGSRSPGRNPYRVCESPVAKAVLRTCLGPVCRLWAAQALSQQPRPSNSLPRPEASPFLPPRPSSQPFSFHAFFSPGRLRIRRSSHVHLKGTSALRGGWEGRAAGEFPPPA